MVDGHNMALKGAFLRGAGLVLLGLCWLLTHWLLHAAGLHRHHDPSTGELAAAAAGFLCFSLGAALAALGLHLFDRVEVSQRWASSPYPPPA